MITPEGNLLVSDRAAEELAAREEPYTAEEIAGAERGLAEFAERSRRAAARARQEEAELVLREDPPGAAGNSRERPELRLQRP